MDSPGNALYPNSPPMRRPHLSFLYRLECDIDSKEIDIGAPHGTGVIRSIANIVSGTVKGPEIEGEVLPLGGADWATVIEGTHVRFFIFISLFFISFSLYYPVQRLHSNDNTKTMDSP